MTLLKKCFPSVVTGILLITLPSFAYSKDIVIIEKDQKYFNNNKEVTGTTIEATVGDNLVLVNNDRVDHCVRAVLSGKVLNSTQQKPKTQGGTDIIIPLKQAGTLLLKCDIHSSMLLNILIK